MARHQQVKTVCDGCCHCCCCVPSSHLSCPTCVGRLMPVGKNEGTSPSSSSSSAMSASHCECMNAGAQQNNAPLIEGPLKCSPCLSVRSMHHPKVAPRSFPFQHPALSLSRASCMQPDLNTSGPPLPVLTCVDEQGRQCRYERVVADVPEAPRSIPRPNDAIFILYVFVCVRAAGRVGAIELVSQYCQCTGKHNRGLKLTQLGRAL